jgi:hypothetical protein
MSGKLILPPEQQPKGTHCPFLGVTPIINQGSTVSTGLIPCYNEMCKFYKKSKTESCLIKLFFLTKIPKENFE